MTFFRDVFSVCSTFFLTATCSSVVERSCKDLLARGRVAGEKAVPPLLRKMSRIATLLIKNMMLLFSKQLSFSSVETDRCCDVDALQYSVLYEKIRRKIIDDSTFGGKRTFSIRNFNMNKP